MKILKKLIILFSFVFSFSFLTYGEDMLEEVLGIDSEAQNYQIINSNIQQYFVRSKNLSIDFDKDKDKDKDENNDEDDKKERYKLQNVDPLLIRVSKIMLKFAVIIGVIVFLIAGIRFLLSFGEDSKAVKIRDNLIVAVIGILIAFMSFVILQIILSIGSSIPGS